VTATAPADDELPTLLTDLTAFFARRLPGGDGADDLAQDTLLRALTHWSDLRRTAARRAWVFSIARNLLHDQARLRHPIPAGTPGDLLPDAPCPEAPTPTTIQRAVREGLAMLPARQRHILLLHLFDDLSLADIAKPRASAWRRAERAWAPHLGCAGWASPKAPRTVAPTTACAACARRS